MLDTFQRRKLLAYLDSSIGGCICQFQVQERMTHQIASTIQEILQPGGVDVVVEPLATMMMRGVEKRESYDNQFHAGLLCE